MVDVSIRGKVMRLLLILVAATLLAGCAAAGPASSSQGTSAVVAQAQEPRDETGAVPRTYTEDPEYWEEIICKRADTTGTRLHNRRCHSRYDWARMSGSAREIMRDINANPLPCGSGAGCAPGD